MKKSITIFSMALTTLSLMAFGFVNWNDPLTAQVETPSTSSIALYNPLVSYIDDKVYVDFFYDVGSRFSGITKADVDKARLVDDFLPQELTQQIESYQSVSVIIIENDEQTDMRETGYSGMLTFDQINLLQSFDYSTNFLIRADFQEMNAVSGALENNYASPHLTMVPEKQAVYANGKDALLEYLSKNNKENTANLNIDKLRPAKLYFTVSKKGAISNVRLDRTSGYSNIDNTMIELINKAPGMWVPAEDSNGQKVDQELVISFGMIGC